MTVSDPASPAWLRTARLLLLVLLLVAGALIVLLGFPFCTDRRRLALKARWSQAVLAALGVEVDADLAHARPGVMLVANHISWIDIFVLNAVLPAAFVAKEEVRHWPLIGWLAAKNDTVFLRRGSRGHARIINGEIAAILDAGKQVAVFPEGTTTDGTHLLHFHAALLQPALSAGRPVLPVAISYWTPEGARSLVPRYDGDISLGQCTRAIVGQQRIIARLRTTPPLGMAGEDRRAVAQAARSAIRAACALPPEPPSGQVVSA